MGVQIEACDDPEVTDFVFRTLTDRGFVAKLQGQIVHIDGAGVGLGDHSVDLRISTISLDGVRVVRLSSILRTVPAGFDAAVLACARGNGACELPKFEAVEETAGSSGSGESLFRIHASVHLYADHLSADEFHRMTWLFLKETDAIDNELADIMGGGVTTVQWRC